MSDKYETIADFAAKVEWEGGALAAMQYGLTEEDIPDDGSETSKRLYELWAEARAAISVFGQIDDLISEQL